MEEPYVQDAIPTILKQYFASLEQSNGNKELLQQWQDYFAPNDKTDSDWEHRPKPKPGYLVPIMVGYKAISSVYPAGNVKNTRDTDTPVCFVEAAHSVGEWKGIHRIKSMEELNACLWHYHYEQHWYLCKQVTQAPDYLPNSNRTEIETESEIDFY